MLPLLLPIHFFRATCPNSRRRDSFLCEVFQTNIKLSSDNVLIKCNSLLERIGIFFTPHLKFVDRLKYRILERKLIWLCVNGVLIHLKINDFDKVCKKTRNRSEICSIFRIDVKTGVSPYF